MKNTIKLSDGKEYTMTFDVSNTCFSGLDGYDHPAVQDGLFEWLHNIKLFIKLTGDARPEKIIQKRLTDIDIAEFEMTKRGAALVACDFAGKAFCSLVLDDEEPRIFICSMYDTNCL
jgi:hypothetical protein